MATHGDYYNPSDKVVYDGDLAKASDLNAINGDVDSGFTQVANDLDTLETKVDTNQGTAEKWAIDPQGTNPDPLQLTEYSSKANAEESKAWASGVGGVDTEADGSTTITRSAKEYNEDAAANVVLTNADVVSTSADVLLTNADVVSTGNDVVSTNADVVLTGADVVTTGNNVIAAEAAEDGAVIAQGLAEDAQAAAEAVVLVTVAKTSDTGSAVMPSGSTAERDVAPLKGYQRFNEDLLLTETYTGTEWIQGGGGGGLDWTSPVQTADFTAEAGKGYAIDTSGGVVIMTLPPGVDGEQVGYKDEMGTFGTFHLGITPDGTEPIEGVNTTWIADSRGAYGTLVYKPTTQGWLVISASAQNPVINKPYIQVQHVLPSGTGGGSVVLGDNVRQFNQVRSNDISGATLVGSEVTLPAGEYYIDCWMDCMRVGVSRCYIKDSSDNILLTGSGGFTLDLSGVSSTFSVTGKIVLTTSTAISLVLNVDFVQTNNFAQGYSTQNGEEDVFADLRAWKLDSDIKTYTVVHQPVNQPVVGAETTGGIYGGELVYVDADTVDVNPVSCMDDGTTQALAIAGTTTVNMVGNTINTIYNFFVVRYNTDTYGIEYDTDVNGANLSGTVTHKRWIGFVLTDASGDIYDFLQSGSKYAFNENVTIYTGVPSGGATVSISSFLPQGRYDSFNIYHTTTAGLYIRTKYYSGGNELSYCGNDYSEKTQIIGSDSFYILGTGNINQKILDVILKR